ncbi:MAG: orotidine-5'-phosphate decarboxylase [Spirochaetales bacterium]|nr:orotidine-5'-phosphate decarboxylase [Spirochaetales bacterium]
MDYFSRLEKRIQSAKTLLCTGLDPRISGKDPYREITAQNKKIIDQAGCYTACFKPNIAFYECWGEEGIRALKDTIKMIPDDIPVLLDAKRGDIGSTAEAYAKAVFEELGVDAVTLNPYMAGTSAEPFLKYGDKGFFFLCRTSNPGVEEIQGLRVVHNNRVTTLYEEIAGQVVSWSSRAGLVVAGNDYSALEHIRTILPNVWILAPGIGPQGGEAGKTALAGVRDDGMGLLAVVVRSILNAEDHGKAAKDFRDTMNRAVEEALERRREKPLKKGPREILKSGILNGMIDTECFRIGEFTLKSGKVSPFYVDMRRISSDAELLWKVGQAYAEMIAKMECDRIAGIPVAGLPLATAASLISGKPLVYPRMTRKDHGSGNLVEGEFKKGETVVMLDDLITTGKSKLEAAELLKQEGLLVKDLVVLLERGAQGRRDMEAAGIRLHAYAQVEELFECIFEQGKIGSKKLDELREYVKE